MQGVKIILAQRYTRLKNALAAHDSEFSTPLKELLRLPELTTLGDKFLANLAVEAAAAPELTPLRTAYATAKLELYDIYYKAQNFVEGHIGQRNQTELAHYIGKGDLLAKAIFLRNALAGNAELTAAVGVDTVQGLAREIGEYEAARDSLHAVEQTTVASDHATDDALRPLLTAFTSTRLYIQAWVVDIGRPELMNEFVLPVVRKTKVAEAAPVSTPAA